MTQQTNPTGLPVGEPLNVEINVRTLLEAGVHFGHQTSRWNPAMAPYIYTIRNGIHIISLPKTVQCWARARQSIVDIVGQGGNVLFVGTKKQVQETVAQEATRCGSFFVSKRWLGGMLTNFGTVRRSVERMKKIEEILKSEEEAQKNGTPTKFTKKERLMYSRELEKLNYSIGGVREMTSIPQLLFVIDVKREDIAIKEARRLDVPVVALVDTNCDPKEATFPIPSNDDGSRAVRLFAQAISDAVIEGKKLLEENLRTGKVVLQPQQTAQSHSGHSDRKDRGDRGDRAGRGGKGRGRHDSVRPNDSAPKVEAVAVAAVEAPALEATPEPEQPN